MKNIKKEFPRRCEQCIVSIEGKRSDARFCSSTCRSKSYRQRLKKWKNAIGQVFSIKDQKTNKIEHHRLTFILAFISFIGSIGFYIGVLHKVYSDDPISTHQLEQVVKDHEVLEQRIEVLENQSE